MPTCSSFAREAALSLMLIAVLPGAVLGQAEEPAEPGFPPGERAPPPAETEPLAGLASIGWLLVVLLLVVIFAFLLRAVVRARRRAHGEGGGPGGGA